MKNKNIEVNCKQLTGQKFTWHEFPDMHTAQLVPTSIHSSVKHLGGLFMLDASTRVGHAQDFFDWLSLLDGGGG